MRLPDVPRLPPGLTADGSPAWPPLWPPLLATRGPGTRSAEHAHHGMHLLVCVEPGARLRVRAGGRTHEAPGLLSAPDVPHAVDARGAEVLLVFLDPESEAGAALRAVLDGPVRLLDERERAQLAAEADPRAIMLSRGAAWPARLVAALGGPSLPPRAPMHPRVRKLLRLLREPAPDHSLEALAQAVGLSPGRLMHAFTESVGLPLRPYLLWLKLQRAAAAIVAGAPLADAAHAAGFADAAHMSRAFRKMLGLPPSQLRPSASRPR